MYKLSLPFFAIALLVLLEGCGGLMKIRDGDTAFELKKYALAVELYNEEYENARMADVRAEKSYFLGESYSRLGNYELASGWYKTAQTLGYGLPAKEAYAHSLMKLEKYDEAALVFSELLNDHGQLDEWQNARDVSLQASRWKEEAEDRPIRIQKTNFNSIASDYAPVFVSTDKIIFSSDRPHPDFKGESYGWTGRGYFNYFTFDLNSNSFTEDFDFLNSKFNEGTLAFTGDWKTLFFTRCKSIEGEDGYCQILQTELLNGFWSDPEPLPFQEEGANYAHPTVDEEGNVLIFSYKPPGQEEGYDLYVSYKRGPDWLEPRKLPGAVNTRGNEVFPFLKKDTLYFSSDGHPGMGGLDIFRSVRQADGNWGQVQNLMPPINSGADDFGWVLDSDHQSNDLVLERGFFSSSRDGAVDNIYYYEKFPTEKIEIEPEISYSIVLRGIVFEQLYADPQDPNSRKLGVQNLPFARVEIMSPVDTFIVETRRDGRFSKEVEIDTEYVVAASADGYLRQSKRVDTRGLDKDPANPRMIIPVDIVLEKIFFDQEVILEDIYYDFDRWEIREDAQPTLNKLADLLNDNPELTIELGSHTDCRGTPEYNQELSQNRAQAAVEYLVEDGISERRLRAKGYGKSQLRVDCVCEECTEEEHQQNRRTTFRIISRNE
nr:OmpA family protein [Saprospiraceae bacterium]